ncbi:GNAT family N-acetyltransferase [Rhizobium leguminosarum]|uniref:GNAT family N-acetyltransferase n=1 Tax=Rhizobium leguminosarum TaxID=384 RepID=UPI001C906016|nr:GNAT family N-acetyltransferase [Rhizobium leguminosarum]MBY2915366.1 GNAT family N-acetyltransferase [Rhizobium leguminosarum]MBY2970904.1 GNAT family N-acetyltransferase [Rhizobium leguminosarum]MBY2977971.1 GNAT family N-acetyltransferase [Rhizobium leguminosarum]MBY3006521.1 GNAT family N-acetyltransferase [Rhizobium leguminosarum]
MKLQHFESNEYSWVEGDYTVSTERARIDIRQLWQHYRDEAYWAKDLEYARLKAAIGGSLPIGVYDTSGAVAGFCRVVTDGATFAYMRDVLILEAHRGRGLGSALSKRALRHPDLARVNYWLLRTVDAHGVYAKLGFTPLPDAQTFMIRRTEKVVWPEDEQL